MVTGHVGNTTGAIAHTITKNIIIGGQCIGNGMDVGYGCHHSVAYGCHLYGKIGNPTAMVCGYGPNVGVGCGYRSNHGLYVTIMVGGCGPQCMVGYGYPVIYGHHTGWSGSRSMVT